MISLLADGAPILPALPDPGEIWWTRAGQLGLAQCVTMVLLFFVLRPVAVRGMTCLEALVKATPGAADAMKGAAELAENEVPSVGPGILGRLIALFVAGRVGR